MTFQKNVLMIAVAILIISVSIIGFMLWKAKGNVTYPPEVSLCPDFWEVKRDEDGNVGSFVGKEFDFSAGAYKGPSGKAGKCKWAKKYGVYWDGISDQGVCSKLKQ
jgi:hypothetical protein